MGITTNGVFQWKFQRFANLICVIAIIALVCILGCSSIQSHADLVAAVTTGASKWFFVIALLLACANAVLAGWQIAEDYAQKINISAKLITYVIAVISIVYAIYGLCLLF